MKTWVALAVLVAVGITGGIIKPKGRAIDDLWSGSSLTHRVIRPPNGGNDLDNPQVGAVIARIEEDNKSKTAIRRTYVAPERQRVSYLQEGITSISSY